MSRLDNENDNRQQNNDVIIGKHAVNEALHMGREIVSLLVAKTNRGEKTSKGHGAIIQLCKSRGIPIKEVDSRKLDGYGDGHQGIAAIAACAKYSTIDDVMKIAEDRGEPPFVIVCDELEDPHNLGAILRTAEATGVHGVIVPKRRSAGLTTAVYKASAGAVEHVPVVRVTNVTDTINELKEKGLWVHGLEMDGQVWCESNLTGAIALVVGSEGKGISRLVKENCDVIISLPMVGEIPSLNASVACGVVLYEIARQRNGWGQKPGGAGKGNTSV